MDVETTGSKRNWDRVIEYAVIAHDGNDNKLGEFVRRVNPGEVRIKPAAYAVHDISRHDLRDEPSFAVVGPQLNRFFDEMMQNHDAGVLVAHNGSTDFQFMCCDYQRAGIEIPSKISHLLCTLQVL